MLVLQRIVRLVLRGLLAATLTSLIVLTAGILILYARGDRLLGVETASMVPAFRPGDALIVAPASPRSLHVGEIVSYQSPRNARIIISHRIIHIDTGHGRLLTAGDRLRTEDPSVPASAIVGKATAIAPHLGACLDVLRQPLVFAIVIFLPAAMVLYAEGTRLLRSIACPAYRAPGYKRIM